MKDKSDNKDTCNDMSHEEFMIHHGLEALHIRQGTRICSSCKELFPPLELLMKSQPTDGV